MRLLFLLTLATALALPTTNSRAGNLVTFSFNNNLNAQVQGGVTATSFSGQGSKASVGSASAGPNDDPYNNRQPYAYILVTKNSTNASSAVSNDQFAQFTITPPVKNGMQLGQLQIQAARGGDSTPRGLSLRWSFDGYASDLGSVSVGKTWTDTGNYTINVNAFAGSPITFRLYAYGKQGGSQALISVRLTSLVVTGDPVLYPPVVTPASLRNKTFKAKFVLRGTAYDSSGITRIEVARENPNGVYTGANGGAKWKYPATDLKVGLNTFYVRAIDTTGTTGPSVKVTVRRTKNNPNPTPTPKPTPKPTP